MTIPEAFPLHWPAGKERTPHHKREPGRFQITPGVARNSLFDELRRMATRYVVVSSDIPLRRDGQPYAGRENPEDPGVAVYFEWKGKQFAFSCDRYNKIHSNIRAIALTIGALRGIERWGTGDMMHAAFSGFTALPAPDNDGSEPWWQVLETDRDDMLEVIERNFRALALDAHPDAGGSHDSMSRLNRAITAARAEKEMQK